VTDPVLTPGVTPVRALHLTELRTALAAVFVAAGLPPRIYTDDPVMPVRAVHVNELRQAIRVRLSTTIWTHSGRCARPTIKEIK
jgi:hypothetical protein